MNQPCVYMKHSESPSHLPPHPIPLGCPRAPALRALLHVSNLHWSSILLMVIYVFHCCSFILSHPLLLPHSPKVCSLHLCLFCCLAYRVVIIIFLNPVKMKSLRYVQLFATPWTVAYQTPQPMGFSRQEYCSGLPFSSPGNRPYPGIEPRSPTL